MNNCKDCNIELTENNCYKKSDGRLRSYCKICHNKRSYNYDKVSSKALHRKEYDLKKLRNDRKNPINLAKIILRDSRNSDRKKNRDNDLTVDFIEKLICNGCSYCGELKLRMTVDRIDNGKGHLQNNVVSACIRCNYARGSMPYEAWLCLVPGLKEARIKGFFNDWTGRCR